jgi:hypothetical protein
VCHDNFDFTAMPSFVAPRYLCLQKTSFDLKEVTPRCLAPPFPARCFKIMRRWRRQDQRDVKIIARIYHDFILDFQHNFYFFHDSAFCSFTLWISPNFYVSPRYFLAFKMGVKIVWRFTIVCFDRAVLSFDTSR